jgi:hypothetical protein
MVALLMRGRAALAARYEGLPRYAQPVGWKEISVVLRVDFIANPEVCLMHARACGPIHILSENGVLCARLSALDRP